MERAQGSFKPCYLSSNLTKLEFVQDFVELHVASFKVTKSVGKMGIPHIPENRNSRRDGLGGHLSLPPAIESESNAAAPSSLPLSKSRIYNIASSLSLFTSLNLLSLSPITQTTSIDLEMGKMEERKVSGNESGKGGYCGRLWKSTSLFQSPSCLSVWGISRARIATGDVIPPSFPSGICF